MGRFCRGRGSGVVLVVVVMINAWARAAFERQVWGGAAASTGGSYLVVWEDPWAAREQPALACLHRTAAISATIHPGAFGLVELRRTGFAAVLPRSWGGIAGGATVYGFELYRDLLIPDYGSAAAWSVDAGALLVLSEGFATAATLTSLLATPLGKSGERPPQEIRLGIIARFDSRFRAGIEWAGDWSYPLGFAAGLEYRPLGALALRCGASSDPPEYTLGIGLRLARLSLDYGVVLHTLLGATHALSLSLSLG
jgi:hypothetical protein